VFAWQGEGEPARQALEAMFVSAGVSAIFTGHVHAYERSAPTVNFKVVPPGPGGIVHLNIGDGGAGLYTTWLSPQPAWSAYRNATWGHGRWQAINNTHSLWAWHDNDVPDGVVLDSVVILNANTKAWPADRLAELQVEAAAAAAAGAPAVEQVHVAYTGTPGQLSVDFVAVDSAGFVEVSSDNATWTRAATTSFYFFTVGWMHQGLLDWGSVGSGQTVFYRVGCGNGTSATFAIVPRPARGAQEVFAVFGDFGLVNNVCLDALVADAEAGVYDSVVHVGDFAYDLESWASLTGNAFMNNMQQYGAQRPVMPTPGNHEACQTCLGVPELDHSDFNFTQYRARMHSVALHAGDRSGSGNAIYYSFEQGLTHFLAFSAEAYAYSSGAAFIANQLAFMRADLASVNRTRTPWVVGLAHKDWTMQADAYADFSPVLEEGGVDVLFVGHVHYYNRYLPTDPVTGRTDRGCVSPDGHTYSNPPYMVTIVTGAPGNQEDDDPCASGGVPSATCTSDYGYGFFAAVNATHATWRYKGVKTGSGAPSTYADTLTVVQSTHGPRSPWSGA